TRPNGASLIGPEAISASHENSFARFEGSQHLVTGHDISIQGNKATVRANLVAMHMCKVVRPARTIWKTFLSQAASSIPNSCRQTGNGRFRRSAMMLSGVPADLETWRRPN